MTAPTPEIIFLNGRPHRMETWPRIPLIPGYIVENPDPEVQRYYGHNSWSSQPKRYQGTWAIRDHDLYLDALWGRHMVVGDPVPAIWFSGILRINRPHRTSTKPEHRGLIQRQKLIYILDGMVIRTRSVIVSTRYNYERETGLLCPRR